MNRFLLGLAAIFAGGSLLLMVIQISTSGRHASFEMPFSQLPTNAGGLVPPVNGEFSLDPVLASQEIASLQRGRGTVLSGSSLKSTEPGEFEAALANFTGVEVPPQEIESDSAAEVRAIGRDIDRLCARMEQSGDIEKADELRICAEQLRTISKSLKR